MLKKYQHYIELENKNKAMLLILWYSIFLMMFVEIIDYVIYQFVDYTFVIENYFFRYITIPFAVHITLGCIATVVYKIYNHRHPKRTGYFMIIAFTLFVQECITIHYGVSVVYAGYVLPIFLSTLFIDKRLTNIIGALCLVMYVPLYFFYLPLMPDHTYKHDFMDFSATLILMAASFIISIYIMTGFQHLIKKIFKADCAKKSLELEVMLDPFTKLYNRSAFDAMLQTVNECDTGSKGFSLLFMDIDDFKHINDSFGHSRGDLVILKLVEIINANIGTLDSAFRYGGEEFAVILHTDVHYARLIAEKIRKEFNEAAIPELPDVHVSISIGMSAVNSHDMTAETLFDRADNALYRAKHRGKNVVVLAE